MPFTPTATETPPFDIMGLLLGGRGYASGWFQNRDKLRQIDLAQQNEVADRQRYTQGVLASPELKGSVAAPYDRMAQWKLWGQTAAGPESMVPLANTLLTQSTGQIYDREQSLLSSSLAAANIRLSADEQLRVDQVQREREAGQKKDLMTYLFSQGQDGGTPGQQQMKRDFAAEQLGIKRPEGYSVTAGMDGLEPTIGGKVWQGMMEEGAAVSNLINSAEMLQTMAATGQGDKDQWAAIRADMLMNIKKAETLGTLDAGTMEFFATVLPDYYGEWGPDVSNQLADKLGTDIKLWKNKQAQVADKYRVPIEQFSGRKAFQNERVPSEDEAVKRFGNPVKPLSAPRGSDRTQKGPARNRGNNTMTAPGEDIFGPQPARPSGR